MNLEIFTKQLSNILEANPNYKDYKICFRNERCENTHNKSIDYFLPDHEKKQLICCEEWF